MRSGYDQDGGLSRRRFLQTAGAAAAKGDYRVRDNSPALKLGFKNFPMDKFGTQKSEYQPVIKEVTAIK